MSVRRTAVGLLASLGVLLPLVATAAPKVEIVSWNMVEFDVAALQVKVSGASYPGGDYALNVYLDDDFLRREMTSMMIELADFPGGLHTVAVMLVERHLGHYLQVPGGMTQDVVSFRAKWPCVGPGDPNCDDGNGCSLDFCTEAAGAYHCEYGVKPWSGTCCTSHFECAVGEVCAGNQCGPCAADEQCADENDCTQDRCEAGACVHEPLALCCNLEGSCDDQDPCTADDQCLAGLCIGTPESCTPDQDSDIGPQVESAGEGGCGVVRASRRGHIGPWLLVLLAMLTIAVARWAKGGIEPSSCPGSSFFYSSSGPSSEFRMGAPPANRRVPLP